MRREAVVTPAPQRIDNERVDVDDLVTEPLFGARLLQHHVLRARPGFGQRRARAEKYRPKDGDEKPGFLEKPHA